MATIIDGKAIAAEIRADLRSQVQTLRQRGVLPSLAVVLVGEDPASQLYVRGKVRVATEIGISSRDYQLDARIAQAALLRLIDDLNGDPSVHGILVQLPLPGDLDSRAILEAIDPRKDVDGLHPFNLGRLMSGAIDRPPCTPSGILELLKRADVPLDGADAVVVGRSNLVGKPTALLLLHQHATVTQCHSHTRDLAAVCRRADVLVVAAGRPRLIGAEHVKPGAAVIDVGVNRVDGKLVGDVDFAAVAPIAGAITPVPGGVGPMTVAMLMRNTLRAAGAP